MSVYEAILNRRTIRKFQQKPIDVEILKKLIDAARVAPSAANLQPIKYKIVNDKADVDKVFEQVKWAGYIAPEGNPKENERPTAFIVILADTEIRKTGYELDIGFAAQNISLTAEEERIGTCMMGAIDRDNIREILQIHEKYIINSVIALGYKGESPVFEDENGTIKYYKDENGVLHVPKRKLDDIIV